MYLSDYKSAIIPVIPKEASRVNSCFMGHIDNLKNMHGEVVSIKQLSCLYSIGWYRLYLRIKRADITE